MSRKDVPYFGPFIRRPFVYKKNRNLKSFLLAKLINAEYSSLQAPGFSQYSVVALTQSLQTLTDDLRRSSLKFNNCYKLNQDTGHLSSVLKRTSVYKAITTKSPLDTIRDPLNRALSRSGYLSRDKQNEEDSKTVAPDSPIREQNIKLREKKISESNSSDTPFKDLSGNDTVTNKRHSVHPILGSRSTFTYGESVS